MNWRDDWEGYCTVLLVRARLIGVLVSEQATRTFMERIRFDHNRLMNYEMNLLHLETEASHAVQEE
jgi:hypothetical protein